ncbi:hypothetical protein [Streptomyces sp. NPDC008092]|uniref:hypothetical protein n=1 Tax=Streptomyces sp. NPDC008092 TaxID=3364808 RepID=UPI0036EDD593
MTEHTPGYIDALAGQLRGRRPDLLALAETELQQLRGRMQTIARFINNQTIPLDVRQGLAQDLHLPTPEK